MSDQASKAIKATKGKWGFYATRRFLEKNNVPYALYRLACQLEVATKAGF